MTDHNRYRDVLMVRPCILFKRKLCSLLNKNAPLSLKIEAVLAD